MNNYIYNPLLKYNLQFSGNGGDTPTPGGLQKVSKFFAATDELQDDEIAQYQGETDTQNNLFPGLFYKKTLDYVKQPTGTTSSYNSNTLINITDYAGNVTTYQQLKIQNYVNCQNRIFHCSNNVDIFAFSDTLLNKEKLQEFQYVGTTYYVYPFCRVNGTWDLVNEIQIINNNFYYNGSRLTIQSGQGGDISGRLCTDANEENLFFTNFQFIFKIDSSNNILLFSPLIDSYVKSNTVTSQTSKTIVINNYTYQYQGAGFVQVQVQNVDNTLNPLSNNAISNAATAAAIAAAINSILTQKSYTNSTNIADTELQLFIINKLCFGLMQVNVKNTTDNLNTSFITIPITDVNFKNTTNYFDLIGHTPEDYYVTVIYCIESNTIINPRRITNTGQFNGFFIAEIE